VIELFLIVFKVKLEINNLFCLFGRSRYLRNADRQKNSMCYPYLDYPEMYLLDGGYCKFYSQHSHLCVPSSYRSMYDPAHTSELRKFRSKSKTWACHNDAAPRVAGKNTLKRLGFN